MQIYAPTATGTGERQRSAASATNLEHRRQAAAAAGSGSSGASNASLKRDALFGTATGPSGKEGPGVVKEATDMIQGFFSVMQKKVHEVFNDEDDISQALVDRSFVRQNLRDAGLRTTEKGGGSGLGQSGERRSQRLFQPSDPRNVVPVQQGMSSKEVKKRPVAATSSSTKRECDKTLWRQAIENSGSSCRDLHHSHRVVYDVHRCLIMGTEIEFTCEVDTIGAHVKEKSTTIEECLKMLTSKQDQKPAAEAAPAATDQAAAMRNEVAAPITHSRPILRKNRASWDWPLSKECYRQRFIEVLKTECAEVSDEKEQVMMDRDALLDKLESIQSAFK